MIQEAIYSKHVQADFSATLNRRVRSYFKNNGIHPQAGQSMVAKSASLFGFYTAVYLLIIFGGISSLVLLFLLWFLLGIGQSFIGMSVMHDAVHGAYTKNRFVYYLLQVPIVAIGVEPRIWEIEHNVLHHTYPNIEGVDQDIHPRYVFRFTEHQPKKWFHAYQHIYATLIYGLLIIEWITVKDFVKAIKYHRMGFFKSWRETATVTGIILFKKLLFYFVFLYVPLQLLPFGSLMIAAMFLTMLVTAGISMSIVFQLAHVVSCCDTESDTTGLKNKNWHVHQLETTCDFAHGNKLVTYLIGGLNYQVEHHLFPQVCHVHYPAISAIIRQTADEFGVQYHYEATFRGAIKAHYRHLKALGK